MSRVEARVRAAVRFASSTHMHCLVLPGSLAGVPTCRSRVEALVVGRRWICVAARPARRVRVCLPGLVTSAVTGPMAAVQALRVRLRPRHRSNSRAQKNTHPAFLSQLGCPHILLPQLLRRRRQESPRPQEDTVQHRLRQSAGVGVLLAHVNVSAPKACLSGPHESGVGPVRLGQLGTRCDRDWRLMAVEDPIGLVQQHSHTTLAEGDTEVQHRRSSRPIERQNAVCSRTWPSWPAPATRRLWRPSWTC